VKVFEEDMRTVVGSCLWLNDWAVIGLINRIAFTARNAILVVIVNLLALIVASLDSLRIPAPSTALAQTALSFTVFRHFIH